MFKQFALIFCLLGASAAYCECPQGMVSIATSDPDQSFCMDRYEAPNIKGQKPFLAHTALEGQSWCASQGKEMCTDVMWEKACEGTEDRTFAYGMEYVPGTCNDDKTLRAVTWSLVRAYNPAKPEANPEATNYVLTTLNQSEPSGSRPDCKSEDGVIDMVGNAAEWVVNTKEIPSRNGSGTHPFVMKGCYWAGCFKGHLPSCKFTNSNHGAKFRSYEAGFRCCSKQAKTLPEILEISDEE